MSTGRRYEAGEMRKMAAEFRETTVAAFKPIAMMLDQASETEAQVMGLVEAAYREGFRDGAVDCLADDRGLGGVGEDAYWSGSEAREALSKFRGEL